MQIKIKIKIKSWGGGYRESDERRGSVGFVRATICCQVK